MQFKDLVNLIQAQFDKMSQGQLYRSKIEGQDIWNLYLGSFKSGDDPIFRDPKSSYHNGNNDKNFIRRYGNIVSLDENLNIMTMFDVGVTGSIYESSMKAMSEALRAAKIQSVFIETFDSLNSLPYERCNKTQPMYKLGIVTNSKQYSKAEAEMYGVVQEREIRKFFHFNLNLPAKFVDTSGKSIESILGELNSSFGVFKRGLEDISIETLDLVKLLITEKSVKNAEAHLSKIENFAEVKEKFEVSNQKDNFVWENIKNPYAKFRNELIGTLCIDMDEGIEQAVDKWNVRADSANYMKVKMEATPMQRRDAEKFVVENGYENSFDRKFATLKDIDLEEIRHISIGKPKQAGLFEDVKVVKSEKPLSFENVQEVSIDNFMQEILLNCSSVELFVENRLEDHFVALTTSVANSKPIFKWSNQFSWTYRNNLTGKSMIKEEVKRKGGNVDGVLRASLLWNESGQDISDLDLWSRQPDKQEIGFSTNFRADRGKMFSSCGGQLDLDVVTPNGIAVENIYFQDLNRLKEGDYDFYVNPYNAQNSQGFKMEVAFEGKSFQYEYDLPLGRKIHVARVSFKDGKFTIEHKLPCVESQKSISIWGLNTFEFHKVNLVCLSPNHWGNNNIGNKHFLFMLDNCRSDVPLRSFHNENLNSDLLGFKRIMETLGEVRKLEPTDSQLCGIGFNATVEDSFVLKIDSKKVIRVKV